MLKELRTIIFIKKKNCTWFSKSIIIINKLNLTFIENNYNSLL